MPGSVDQVQQVVVPLVVVDHGARLRLDRDASLPLYIELVQNLLVAARLNGARELQQPVRQRAFAMVNMRYNAEIAISLNWYLGDAFLQLRLRSKGLRIAPGEVGQRGEAFTAVQGGREAIAANGMRAPTLQEAARGPDA